jgi:hypothetical protein
MDEEIRTHKSKREQLNQQHEERERERESVILDCKSVEEMGKKKKKQEK